MSGHGHVRPNADGSKAKCGGPSLCAVCAQERSEAHDAALDAEWNAAIEEAALLVQQQFGNMNPVKVAERVRALKREVKP